MLAFWSSLATVFLAELGDKTQLVALSLAGRFNARVVLAGIFVATLAVHVISVALGGCAGRFFDDYGGWIKFFAGLAFIGFGYWTLRGDSIDEEDECKCKGRSAFWIVACTFFMAELGDKTMIATIVCATDPKVPLIPVWLGSSLGMVVSDGLAILVGRLLGTTLPEKPVKIGASVIFFGFGVYSMVQGGLLNKETHIPASVWAAAIALIIAGGVWLYRSAQKEKAAKALIESQEWPEEDAEPVSARD